MATHPSKLEAVVLTAEEKVEIYEKLLHSIQMCAEVSMKHDRVREYITRICNWSYSHRVGNGEYSDEEQNALIEAATIRLTKDIKPT